MRLAQQLYEGVDLGGETVGLITYMRTDGVQMAREAIAATAPADRRTISARATCRSARAIYSSPAKNAQEAHEAIRPTDVARTPEEVARHLDDDQRRLYELIWKRAVASQMHSAELDQISVDIADPTGEHPAARHRLGRSLFDGFLKLYREDQDDRRSRADGRRSRGPPPAERCARATR